MSTSSLVTSGSSDSFRSEDDSIVKVEDESIMKEADDSDEEDPTHKIEIYTRRWAILTALCVLNIASFFVANSFTLTNYVYTSYFNVSIAEMDWLNLGMYAGSTLVTPPLAWLCYTEVVGFRIMAIASALSFSLSSMFILVAVLVPTLFSLMLLVNIFHGITYSVSLSVSFFFAVLWFPESQVGTAIAANIASCATGTALGLLVSAQFAGNPFSFDKAADSNLTVVDWTWNHKINLLGIHGAMGAVSLLLVCFMLIFAADYPPKPPSLSQLKKRQNNKNKIKHKPKFGDFLGACKQLLCNKTYVLSSIVFGTLFVLVDVEILNSSQLVQAILPSFHTSTHSDIISSYFLSLAVATGVVGNFISAKLLRVVNKHFNQAKVGAFCTSFTLLALVLSYHYKSLTGIYGSNAAFGFWSRICVIPLTEIITKYTYPLPETFVSVCMSGVSAIICIFLSEIGRLLSTFTPPVSVLIFMVCCSCVAFLLTLFIKASDTKKAVKHKFEHY